MDEKFSLRGPDGITKPLPISCFELKHKIERSGFIENANFWNSTMESWGERLSLEERISQIKTEHDTYSEIYINEQGTPVSLKYEGSEDMFVNGWWVLYAKKGDKWFSVPFKSEHQVNSDGKIVSESLYYSSNRFE